MPNFLTPDRIRQTTVTMNANPDTVRTPQRVHNIRYTVPSGVVSGDTIEVIALKDGDYLLPTSKVYNGAAGSGVTLAVGLVGSATLYKAATSIATAGNIDIDATPLTRTAVTTDSVVLATFGGGNPAANTVLHFQLIVAGV
jgi:hypothetical protein